MNAPAPEGALRPLWRMAGGAILAIWLAAPAPILVAAALIEPRWTHNEPPWAWLLIPILPLIGLALAFSKWGAPAWRGLAVLGGAVGATAFTMLKFSIWPAVATILMAIALLTLAATVPAAVRARSPGLFGRALLVWTGCVLGFGILAAFVEEFVIAQKAETIAGGRPYCIEYASQTDAFGYEPVKTLFDINGLKMRARLLEGGSTMFRNQNHALLIIEAGDGRTKWLSWSYMEQSFVPGNGVKKLACLPASHYLKTLSQR